uniref:Uncharacterized protein n=1 Tax=Sphaerodactylus townsendi TaxID=933632 RepID=A0ACB8ECM3_9SAUR
MSLVGWTAGLETLNRNTKRMNEINSILTEWNCLKILIEGMASQQRSPKNPGEIPSAKQVAETIKQPQTDPALHSQLPDLSTHQQLIQHQTINRENLKSPLKPLNQEIDIDIDLRSERVLNYRDFRSSGGKSWAAELEELQLCSIDPSPGTTSDTITHNVNRIPSNGCDLNAPYGLSLVSSQPLTPSLAGSQLGLSVHTWCREEESQPQPSGDNNKEVKSTTIHERQNPQRTEDFDLDLRSSRVLQTDPGSVTFGKSWMEELAELATTSYQTTKTNLNHDLDPLNLVQLVPASIQLHTMNQEYDSLHTDTQRAVVTPDQPPGNSMGIPNRGPMNGCIQYDMPATKEITPAD